MVGIARTEPKEKKKGKASSIRKEIIQFVYIEHHLENIYKILEITGDSHRVVKYKIHIENVIAPL